MTLGDLGEKAFLAALLPSLKKDSNFINGFGHDASVLDIGLDVDIAMKIDRAPFPVAVLRGVGDYDIWGKLAVVANVSDLLASGAVPKALMLSMVLPREFSEKSARDIVFGCEAACRSHGIAFLGGDTKEGLTAQIVAAAFGTVAKHRSINRAKAAPGDSLFVAGHIGGFSAALTLLSDARLSTENFSRCADVLRNPFACIKEAGLLRESGLVATACDLSDGLFDALEVFCDSEVGILIDGSALPLHPLTLLASDFKNVHPWKFAFGVGDWAIAFVVKRENVDELKKLANPFCAFAEIGKFDKSGIRSLIWKEKKYPVPKIVNEQFVRRIEDDGDYLSKLLAG